MMVLERLEIRTRSSSRSRSWETYPSAGTHSIRERRSPWPSGRLSFRLCGNWRHGPWARHHAPGRNEPVRYSRPQYVHAADRTGNLPEQAYQRLRNPPASPQSGVEVVERPSPRQVTMKQQKRGLLETDMPGKILNPIAAIFENARPLAFLDIRDRRLGRDHSLEPRMILVRISRLTADFEGGKRGRSLRYWADGPTRNRIPERPNRPDQVTTTRSVHHGPLHCNLASAPALFLFLAGRSDFDSCANDGRFLLTRSVSEERSSGPSPDAQPISAITLRVSMGHAQCIRKLL